MASLNKEKQVISDIYKCECGQIMHSTRQPEPINWSDGHICYLIKKEEKEKNNESILTDKESTTRL